MSNDQVDAAALRFFARLAPSVRELIVRIDDELTSDEADQFFRSVDRKIISLRMRIIEERHFKLHPPPGGEPQTELETEEAVNSIMSSRSTDS